MPLTARYGDKLLVAPDLTEEEWSPVWRPGRRIELRCPGCGAPMKAVRPASRTDHFAHLAKQESCILASESQDHLVLKAALRAACRAVDGWDAALEVRGDHDGRSWFADVLATGPDGRRVVFEVQLSHQAADIVERRSNARLLAGCEVVWVYRPLRPMGIGPFLLVDPQTGQTAGPFRKWDADEDEWTRPDGPLPLANAVRAVLRRTLVWTGERELQGPPAGCWTTRSALVAHERWVRDPERKAERERLAAERTAAERRFRAILARRAEEATEERQRRDAARDNQRRVEGARDAAERAVRVRHDARVMAWAPSASIAARYVERMLTRWGWPVEVRRGRPDMVWVQVAGRSLAVAVWTMADDADILVLHPAADAPDVRVPVCRVRWGQPDLWDAGVRDLTHRLTVIARLR